MQNTTYAIDPDLRLYAAHVSSSIYVSILSCVVGAVPSVLCLCWLPVPGMRYAARVISGLQVLPCIVICHIGEQTADHFAHSAVLLVYEGAA